MNFRPKIFQVSGSWTPLLSRNTFYHHNNMPLQDLYLPSRTGEFYLPNHAQESQTWSPSSSIPLHSHMRLAKEDNLRLLLGRCTTEQDHETVGLGNRIKQLNMWVRKVPSPIPDASSLEPSSKMRPEQLWSFSKATWSGLDKNLIQGWGHAIHVKLDLILSWDGCNKLRNQPFC